MFKQKITFNKEAPARKNVGERAADKAKHRRLKSVKVSSRQFDTSAFPFWILDFGTRTFATFGDQPGSFALPTGETIVGPVSQRQLPFSQGLNQLFVTISTGEQIGLFEGPVNRVQRRLSSSTNKAVVRDITIAFDPAADQFQRFDEAFRSFSKSMNLLLSGTLTVFSQPFPTVFSVADAIRVGGGTDNFFTASGGSDRTSLNPKFEATHKRGGGNIEVNIPPAGNVSVGLTVPSFSINGRPYRINGQNAVYAWSGIITTTTEITTHLGEVAGPAYYGDDERCQPGFDVGMMAGGATSLRAMFGNTEWAEKRLGAAAKCPPRLGINIPVVPAGLAPLSNLR